MFQHLLHNRQSLYCTEMNIKKINLSFSSILISYIQYIHVYANANPDNPEYDEVCCLILHTKSRRKI
jgi:hypothetical protein